MSRPQSRVPLPLLPGIDPPDAAPERCAWCGQDQCSCPPSVRRHGMPFSRHMGELPSDQAIRDYPTWVAACFAHPDVQALMADPDLAWGWSGAQIRWNPTVRAVFEGGMVVGGARESLVYGLKKSARFGRFRRYEPIRPEDNLDPRRIGYFVFRHSPHGRRFAEREQERRARKAQKVMRLHGDKMVCSVCGKRQSPKSRQYWTADPEKTERHPICRNSPCGGRLVPIPRPA